MEAALGDARLVHLVDVVRDECHRLGVRRLGLLGTAYTMESPSLYPPRLRDAGIEVVVPGAADRAEVQRITFEELIRDQVLDTSVAGFRRIAQDLVEAGADGVVLACTEHGALLADGDLGDTPVLDSTVLHARALVDASMA